MAGRKNKKCTGVCTVAAEAATRDGIGMYFMRGLGRADIAHSEYFMGRVWNKIKFATR